MEFVITLLADAKKTPLSEASQQSMVLSLASQDIVVEKPIFTDKIVFYS
ncbi:MAG: hypothetical protein AABY33_00830 [Pseudomonadota bacterium]